MTVPVAFFVGFGFGVFAAVCAAAAWSWWSEFAAAREVVQPESIDGDVPFLGHALAIWSGIHAAAPGNGEPGSPPAEQKVAHG